MLDFSEWRFFDVNYFWRFFFSASDKLFILLYFNQKFTSMWATYSFCRTRNHFERSLYTKLFLYIPNIADIETIWHNFKTEVIGKHQENI